MNIPLTATAATVFLYESEISIDKIKTKVDYHNSYHSKRPPNPAIFDKFFFVNQTNTKENLNEIKLIENLVRIHDLRSVNFIILSKDTKPITEENTSKFKDMLSTWDTLFKTNSYSGFLTLGVCTEYFRALLCENYQVRRIERLSLALSKKHYS